MPEVFRFNNREEVVFFDKMLRTHLERRRIMVLDYFSLVSPYDNLPTKTFYSYFDLIINIVLLGVDLDDCMKIYNEKFSSKPQEIRSVLDSIDIFSGKMDMHRCQSSFIFRYRAVWDKLMGFLILLISPEEYNAFIKADSRKGSFKKIAKNHLDSSPYLSEIIKIIDNDIKQFDDDFRTPEAHYAGRLRKWSFITLPWRQDPAILLYGYYNLLNHTMKGILTVLNQK